MPSQILSLFVHKGLIQLPVSIELPSDSNQLAPVLHIQDRPSTRSYYLWLPKFISGKEIICARETNSLRNFSSHANK